MATSTKIKMQPKQIQYILIKLSMIFVLIFLIIFCGLMSSNQNHHFILTNRILTSRSYEESFKNLILNKFNKTVKPSSIPVTITSPVSPPSLSSVSETSSSPLSLINERPQQTSDEKQQLIYYDDSNTSRINEKRTRETLESGPPSDDIKRRILSILSSKVRRQHQNRPPSTFDLPLRRPFLFANNKKNEYDETPPLSSPLKQNNEQENDQMTESQYSHFDNPLPSASNGSPSFEWTLSKPSSSDETDDDGYGDDEHNGHYHNEPSISNHLSSTSSSSSSPLDFDDATYTTLSPTTFQNNSNLMETSSPLPFLNLSSSSQKIDLLFRELNNRHVFLGNSANNNNDSNVSIAKPQQTNLEQDLAQFQNESCENVMITVLTNHEIYSPNYPNRYPPNSDCKWHIQSQKDQLLKIQIFKLHIEHDRACRFDRLDIKGVHQLDRKTGKTVIRTKRFCGHYLKGSEFEIGANHTTIEFHSDSYNEYPGFHLRIIAQSQDCTNEMFIHNFSYITSPNFPEPYEDSKNCWTWVHTRDDHRLLVNFEELHLESGLHCQYDFVEIFDSSTALPTKLLGKFCTFPENSKLYIHSTANSLLFHFESDNFLVLKGYKAKIVALRNDVNISSYIECNWNADWQNMTISSPLYPEPYPTGSQCETSITAPSPNERIILLFDWIDLVDQDYNDDFFGEHTTLNNGKQQTTAYDNTDVQNGRSTSFRYYRPFNCSLDRLEIYEHINDTEPSNVFCGFCSQPFRYVSQTDSIRLVFRSVSQQMSSNYNTNRLRNTPSMSDRTRSSPFYGILNPGFRAKFTFMTVEENSTDAVIYNNDMNHFQTDQYRSSAQSIKAQQSDSGFNSGSNAASNALMLVHRPVNASVRLGSSHILYCEVKSPSDDGQLVPIIWFKGDREIHDGVPNNGTSLMIREFTPKSVGRYICVYGDNSSDAWLTLKPDTPKCSTSNVLFRERPRDQFTSEGEFVMLHCSATLADSHQDVEITWKRLPLVHQHYHAEDDRDQHFKPQPVIYNSRIKKLSRGDLLFDRVLVEDSGYYFCIVRLDQQPYGSESNYDNSSEDENDDDDDDCVLKSVARVQINRRVDVRDFCGRTSIIQNEPETKEDVRKIIGGTEAKPGEFPWMVMFWDEKRHVFCGGALLNERWVVTAAHCFTDILDESTVFVKLGKYDQTETEPSEIVTKIQHTIKHPHFSNETFDNDIALVKLTTHIQFTDNIRPICLATSTEEVRQMNSYFFSRDFINTDNMDDMDEEAKRTKFGFVTGWGRLKENGPLPRYLHKIRLPIVDRTKCRQSTTFKVTDNMFCAGYGKEIVGDACKGDSGGPLVVEFHSRWTLLGIVSWGEGCGRPEKYGYYTKVNNYDNWIRRLTAVH